MKRFIIKVLNKINERHYGKINKSSIDKGKYKEFLNSEDSEDWGTNIYEKWSDNYKKIMNTLRSPSTNNKIIDVIELYCGHQYKGINKYLRYNEDLENNIYREQSNGLMLILATAP